MLKRKNRQQNHQRSRECMAQTGPVGLAVSREQMRRHMIDFAIELYVTDDGAEASQLLGHLAWVLAVGAEIAAHTDHGSSTAKSVHAALRTVVAMSAAGNRWQAAQARVLHQAVTDAQALMTAHPVQPQDLRDSAEWLAARVQAGIATLADVAGPEIYAAAAADENSKTIAANAYPVSINGTFQ